MAAQPDTSMVLSKPVGSHTWPEMSGTTFAVTTSFYKEGTKSILRDQLTAHFPSCIAGEITRIDLRTFRLRLVHNSSISSEAIQEELQRISGLVDIVDITSQKRSLAPHPCAESLALYLVKNDSHHRKKCEGTGTPPLDTPYVIDATKGQSLPFYLSNLLPPAL